MVLFYRDYLGKGGAPSEIRTFIDFARKNECDIDIVYSYKALLAYILKYRTRSKIVFVGFFFAPYLFFWLFLSLLRVRFAIWPLAHISRYSINKKLFTVTPIINELNAHRRFHKEQRSYAKPIFMFLAQLLFKFNKPKFWVFSGFELSEIEHYFGEVDSRIVYWVCGENIKYYEDVALDKRLKQEHPGKKVLLSWSRIDVYNKGLDRFHELTQVLNKEKDAWLSITCGPYYAGDTSSIPSNDNWLLLDTTRSSPYDVQFMMTDFIVLLSRWDGFPRVLREAVYHQKPMIISPETHFRDLVEEFNLGVVFDGNYEKLAQSIQQYEVSSSDFSGALERINNSFAI